jgi:hypothetical protein
VKIFDDFLHFFLTNDSGQPLAEVLIALTARNVVVVHVCLVEAIYEMITSLSEKQTKDAEAGLFVSGDAGGLNW